MQLPEWLKPGTRMVLRRQIGSDIEWHDKIYTIKTVHKTGRFTLDGSSYQYKTLGAESNSAQACGDHFGYRNRPTMDVLTPEIEVKIVLIARADKARRVLFDEAERLDHIARKGTKQQMIEEAQKIVARSGGNLFGEQD